MKWDCQKEDLGFCLNMLFEVVVISVLLSFLPIKSYLSWDGSVVLLAIDWYSKELPI